MMKSMYKSFSSLLAISLFTFIVSCKEDDEVVVATEAELIGTWTTQSSQVDATINGKDMIDFLIDAFEMTEQEAQIAKEAFEADNEMDSGTTIELKSNHTYTAKATGEDPDDGTWKLSTDGKKLLIDEGTDDEMEFEIKSISGSNLSLFTERSEKDDLDQDGTDDTIAVKLTLNLKK